MQEQLYGIASKSDSRKIADFLSKDDQLLLPLLELICNTEQAVDELTDVVGKAAIEAVLLFRSAQQVAGPKQPGKARSQITCHGRQRGVKGNGILFGKFYGASELGKMPEASSA